ncbi:T9SS type A sorting domain-containing protein [Epilithonimonas sp.]|uniref:T9SS type A sorting domain-containing protein n=1 Tax=Epilithonimonas sp. TaxID=2894511 RepID=UPI0035ADA64E
MRNLYSKLFNSLRLLIATFDTKIRVKYPVRLKVRTYTMFFLIMLSTVNFVKSQTVLSAGDILITSFDATKTVADDKFSFVSLKDLQPNTIIYFTDRGFFGNNNWFAANGGTEGSIAWSLGSETITAGTEIVIQSLTAKVNGATKGTVTSVSGSNPSGLSLSHPSGDQIIIFQGGNGNPSASGVVIVGGFHWNYCPNGYYAVYTTDAGWDNIGSGSSCTTSTNSSNMPPGLDSNSAFWIGFYKPTAPQTDIQNYTRGQFNGNGAPFSSLAALKAAILNRDNWVAIKSSDTTTQINVPTGITYYSSCTAPAITSQPSSITICAGSNTTFSATASNATAYQWQVNEGAGFTNISNNSLYSGATTATLSVTGATAGLNGYQYRVVVSGNCSPSATSNGATLTVNAAPAITFQPTDSTICAGANTTFSATASNATAYQWQVNEGAGFTNISNNSLYSGATTATLSVTGATAGLNGYQYRVVVSGNCSPSATSNGATLTVNAAPAITFQPTDSTICAGANTTFSATASNATAYQWQVNEGAGFTNISNNSLYSGATTATLSVTGATAGLNGYQYRVVVSGNCSPSATSNGATLTVNAAPAITLQPTDSTICAGANTTFSATASNATAYQWQVNEGAGFTNISNNSLYSGATTATLSVTGATAGLNGYQYRVVVSGNCSPSATSNGATLTVNTTQAPTGASVQSFEAGNTLSVLAVTGQNIKWYATQNNASNHTGALPLTTMIINDTTYYATQTVAGCESSQPLAVKAFNETLNVVNNKISTVKIYPNPVRETLNFNSEIKINKIVVVSIDGKKILEKDLNGERQVNVHNLMQGTYLVNIITENGTETIKFIKN